MADQNHAGIVMAAAQRAGREFVQQHAEHIRLAAEQGISVLDLRDAFGDGLAKRSPDQAEFDVWWESLDRGQPSAAEDHTDWIIAEQAWLAARVRTCPGGC